MPMNRQSGLSASLLTAAGVMVSLLACRSADPAAPRTAQSSTKPTEQRSGPRPSPTPDTKAGKRVVLPHGLVGVSFKGLDVAPVVKLSLRDALKLQAAVEAEHRRDYRKVGHRRWFFHAFDRHYLYFGVGRYHLACRGKLGCLQYRFKTIHRVARENDAATRLGVHKRVALYEVGVQGVRGGMTRQAVRRILGEPEQQAGLQYLGSYRWVYPRLTITFIAYRVAFIHQR